MELAIHALVCFCIGSVAVFGSYWVRSSSTAPANTDRARRGPPPSHATAAPWAPTAAHAGISLSPLPIFSLGSRRRQLGHSDKRAPRVAPSRPRIPSLHDKHPSFKCRARASAPCLRPAWRCCPQDAAHGSLISAIAWDRHLPTFGARSVEVCCLKIPCCCWFDLVLFDFVSGFGLDCL